MRFLLTPWPPVEQERKEKNMSALMKWSKLGRNMRSMRWVLVDWGSQVCINGVTCSKLDCGSYVQIVVYRIAVTTMKADFHHGIDSLY
ncbi:hypothetical protein F9C07_8147 [Aspergillus flavus]|uniref:Uncharacterized protein n=1 Tax=Aspergillus flavus (strain ATCC 200026 / FGSC A1120 / IAM 13836 / NRRL 3357 / JCM 12722 / SRRC 167) TaxID=332952 RepID=A0A7U2N1A5_ASPFN|nr:hypothetical protein F9C07_8147 [Aspergillus flavus]